MIEIENLTKCFDDFTAVDQINFKVFEGEVLGFLGPNGAGKTTTLRMLTCYMPPTRGRVKIGDFDILSDSLEIRRRLGYLPENTPLYSDQTVVEHLKFIAPLRGIPVEKRKAEIDRVTQICALESVFYKPVEILSKGYRQRLGLALALIHDPEILILDEPTSGLDPRQILEIRNLIKEIGQEKTIILSSHILPEVSATCDRVVIINKGRIAGKGTPEELQAGQKGEALLITTLRGPYAAIKAGLEGLPGVKMVEKETEICENTHHFEICVDPGENPQEALFEKARDEGWVMTELYLKQMSLEEVFMALTLEHPEAESYDPEAAHE